MGWKVLVKVVTIHERISVVFDLIMLTLTYRGDVYVKSDHGMGWDEGGGGVSLS